MTTVTISWRALVYVVYVTGSALHVFMLTRQCEAGYAMIEMHILPDAGVVTSTTVGAELSIMGILRGMTAITIGGCTFVFTIDMAGRTRHADMTACQCETGGTVIELHILPVARVMACGAIIAHLAVMNICVAGGAAHGCVFEDQILMAVGTCHAGMFAHQGEGGL